MPSYIFFISFLKQFLYIVDIPFKHDLNLKSFIEEILPNTHNEFPVSFKSDSTNENINQKMLHIFMYAIEQFEINSYLNDINDHLHFSSWNNSNNNYTNNIFSFKNYIDTEILKKFDLYEEMDEYKLIGHFNKLLFELYSLLPFLHLHKLNDFFDTYITPENVYSVYLLSQERLDEIKKQISKKTQNNEPKNDSKLFDILDAQEKQLTFFSTILYNYYLLCSLLDELSSTKYLDSIFCYYK